MGFPTPEASTLASNDVQRDERKRILSPPSSFYAQSQAVLIAVEYFEHLNSGYRGAAIKHMNRIRGALFAQVMASFEFAVKDFIAQTLDVTHIFDAEVKGWKWVDVNVEAVLSTREDYGRIGAVLIHPLLGWQTPKLLNTRYRDVFRRPLVLPNEEQPLQDLWIVRHSVAHNGGVVTHADARRLRSTPLADRQVSIDLQYLYSAIEFLRVITGRLATDFGPILLRRWFAEASAKDWEQDREFYTRIKLLTTCVKSRIRDLPDVDEAVYAADLATY